MATNIGHFKETVRPGQDGLLVGNNADEWGSALNSLIEDTYARETLGRNAGKRVRKDFNVSRNSPKYLKLLKNLANTSVIEDDLVEVA